MGEGEGTIPHVLKGVRIRFEVEGRKGEYSSGSGGKSARMLGVHCLLNSPTKCKCLDSSTELSDWT